MYKVKWSIRTITALHHTNREYTDSRHILDATATELNEWRDEGWVRLGNDRIITWNSIQEISYVEEESQ